MYALVLFPSREMPDDMVVLPTTVEGGNIAEFLEALVANKKLSDCKEPGQPQILVLSPSAIRAVDVVRYIAIFNSIPF